jgi:hypothetical protein
VRERASALPFIREPCILETARPGKIEELRALLDRGGEDALIPEDAAGVPARAAPAWPPCARDAMLQNGDMALTSPRQNGETVVPQLLLSARCADPKGRPGSSQGTICECLRGEILTRKP